METFISILRGINVTGYNTLPMADLRAMYEEMKFKDVTTYIQSGNVICKGANASDEGLAQKIEKAILKKFNLTVPVIIRTVKEIDKVIAANPFTKRKDVDLQRLYVTFLAENPQKANLAAIKSYNNPPDEFVILGKEVYLYCPSGYGNTKLSNTFFENKLKVKATTRNWKTVNKLLELATK
ncbi:MAG TPA: DUF1697 domain-containing protein [Flavipsychrobacter sp.]|nr:DUF1697 domain-containing protein [Flavipsychrobacter sp.]